VVQILYAIQRIHRRTTLAMGRPNSTTAMKAVMPVLSTWTK
jgi:hypothetical protein